MKYYKINKIDDEKTVVFSVSHHSPTEQLDSIANELLRKKFKGVVIFDMLLSNGNTKQRYFESIFNGTSFLNESFKITLVDNSHILPKSIKFLIKKGVI